MEILKENVIFRKWNCDVVKARYQDGSPALVLLDHDTSEKIATATVCLAGYGFTPPPGMAAIKNYSENEGMLTAMSKAGLVEYTGEDFHAGFVEFPIVRLL